MAHPKSTSAAKCLDGVPISSSSTVMGTPLDGVPITVDEGEAECADSDAPVKALAVQLVPGALPRKGETGAVALGENTSSARPHVEKETELPQRRKGVPPAVVPPLKAATADSKKDASGVPVFGKAGHDFEDVSPNTAETALAAACAKTPQGPSKEGPQPLLREPRVFRPSPPRGAEDQTNPPIPPSGEQTPKIDKVLLAQVSSAQEVFGPAPSPQIDKPDFSSSPAVAPPADAKINAESSFAPSPCLQINNLLGVVKERKRENHAREMATRHRNRVFVTANETMARLNLTSLESQHRGGSPPTPPSGGRPLLGAGAAPGGRPPPAPPTSGGTTNAFSGSSHSGLPFSGSSEQDAKKISFSIQNKRAFLSTPGAAGTLSEDEQESGSRSAQVFLSDATRRSSRRREEDRRVEDGSNKSSDDKSRGEAGRAIPIFARVGVPGFFRKEWWVKRMGRKNLFGERRKGRETTETSGYGGLRGTMVRGEREEGAAVWTVMGHITTNCIFVVPIHV